MDCFCRGRRSRDRPCCRAFARSPVPVLGMVCVDHSPSRNDRMRLSHNTLVSALAARVENNSALRQMSASPQSGHWRCTNQSLLRAKSGHRQRRRRVYAGGRICHFFKRPTTAIAAITTTTTSAHISSSEIVSRAQPIICVSSTRSHRRRWKAPQAAPRCQASVRFAD